MFIGSDANGYGKNYIAFYGTTGDNPGEYTHTYIGENLWGGDESSELVLFKGNDIASQVNTVSGPGGDKIRHIAAGHLFQIYNSPLSGTFQGICQSTTPINVFEINKQGIMVTMQNDATFKVYANTNTSYGYETVSLQTAFDAKDPETSGYPASYGHRCTMLLQPLGGQVYIGSNLTTLADSNYKLYVNGNTNIQGQLKIYTNTLFAYDNTDQYLQYTGESYVDSHAGRIDLYKIIASGTAGVAGTKTETISLRAATGDIYASGSIRNLSTSGGIYWSPYVESATDASDAASIYLIKSGAAGGTELRISIANDATDIINLHTPKFIYINEKKVFTVNDTWLRINEDSGYSSGIYTGTSLVRSDNALQVGENGSHFYANSSGNGYIQNTFGVHGTDTTKHFFVNGTSRFADDITMDSGSEILFSKNTQYLRWTANTGDNNSTGRSWYGIGTYQNTSDSNNSWLNISNHWGINITTKGNTYLRHNNNIITTTGNQTGTVGSGTHPIYSSGGVLMASSATVGSGVRGIYLNAGTITPMSYELKATVNSGTANRIAYYSGTTAISSGNNIWTNGTKLQINEISAEKNYNFYVNGTSYFNGDVYLPTEKTIYQNQRDTSNYTTIAIWLKGSTFQKDANGNAYSYQPQIGQHNTGGTNLLGSICILPYATSSNPWDGTVGLFITKNRLMLDNCRVPTTGNTSGNIGSASQPVYINDGVITACTGSQSGAEKQQSFKINGGNGTAHWYYLGNLVSNGDSSEVIIDIYTGNGYNSSGNQNTHISIFIKDGWQSTQAAANSFGISYLVDHSDNNATSIKIKGMASAHNVIDLYVYLPWGYSDGYYSIKGYYNTWTHKGIRSTTEPTSGEVQNCVFGTFRASQVYGAVWNDYAEYRRTKNNVQPGYCVIETGKGNLIKSSERLQPGANIVSDTFGFAIGETEQTKTPLAVSGRVLAYPYEDRYSYSAGDPVCSGPNGTISKMTREEVREYPDRIVGTVSEIPEYETWGTGNIKVDGRIWIKVR